MKPIVYTTIFGNYDEPKPHPDIKADFVCITDNPELSSEYWDIQVHQEYSHLSPRLQAKIFKLMCPFDGLSLFIDGSIEIIDPSIIETLSKYLDKGIAMYVHPSGRDCIKTELMESLPMLKYQGQPIEEQVNHYFAEGMPEHYGLHACGLILRQGRHEELGSRWLVENFKFSIQDQLSLPYIRWKYGYEIDTIPLDQYACFNGGDVLFNIIGHKRDD